MISQTKLIIIVVMLPAYANKINSVTGYIIAHDKGENEGEAMKVYNKTCFEHLKHIILPVTRSINASIEFLPQSFTKSC